MASSYDYSHSQPTPYGAETGELRRAFEEAVNPPVPTPKGFRQTAQRIASSNVGLALIGGLLTMIMLYVINPPMVQTKSAQGDLERPRRNPAKIFAWSTVSGVVILLAPGVIKFIQSRSHK